MNSKRLKSGFTLIELLVVISIIGLLSTLAIVALNNARAKARDAKRLVDMKQIQTALDLYYDANNRYPSISGDACCDGWDQGPCGADPFIGALVNEGLMSNVPTDPSGGSGTGCYGYAYYRYGAGSYGCDPLHGAYYVLGVRDMETSGRPHPNSPGWSCPSRDWQGEFDWVIGKFER
ncbi:type II secretion system GspH family protein [Patescibacteria group bacterium]|nr:type II secretion system GspH family protein [Patescibacteria group bacterium]MBU4512625.1 type II secretion system GspH family protein [Patescibacteria group bacterium]MCG2693531.1 type II secretion system GspH family protein [Candidatus Parcubacteria bacterium]